MADVRILAIEDDPIYVESLRATIEESEYLLIDVVDTIADFQRLVKATLPDIMIFDIDLGEEMDGIELAQLVTKEHEVPYIFVTSFEDQETVKRATATLPASYLTKPCSAGSLKAAIELAILQKSNAAKAKDTTSESGFFIKEGDSLVRIDLENLLSLEAQNKQTEMQFANECKTVSAQFREIAESLPSNFVQIHRSFMVNASKVEKIDASYTSIEMLGKKIPVGRKYREELMKVLLKLG